MTRAAVKEKIMPTMYRLLKNKYGKSCKNRDVLRRAVRAEIPGGDHAINRLKRLSEQAMFARREGNGTKLRDILAEQDKAQRVVDEMIETVIGRYQPLATPTEATPPTPLPPKHEMLGQRPDAALAAEEGCSRETVRRRRLRLGIAAMRPEFTWTDKADKIVLAMGNADAAKRLRVSNTAVRVRRCRLTARS
jgi:hypothetical protein